MKINVAIDEELYQKVSKIVEKNTVDYPSINNFVNKAVKEKLEKKMEGD